MTTALTKIDYHKCNGCKRCYELCPVDIYAWDKERDVPVVAYPEECWHCGVCWMECPKRAIDCFYPASFW